MKAKLGKKATFQLTVKQREILDEKSDLMQIKMAALIRGIIRYKMENVKGDN